MLHTPHQQKSAEFLFLGLFTWPAKKPQKHRNTQMHETFVNTLNFLSFSRFHHQMWVDPHFSCFTRHKNHQKSWRRRSQVSAKDLRALVFLSTSVWGKEPKPRKPKILLWSFLAFISSTSCKTWARVDSQGDKNPKVQPKSEKKNGVYTAQAELSCDFFSTDEHNIFQRTEKQI